MAASNRMTIDLEGFDALTRAFNSLPGALQNRFLRPALRAGAKVMLKSVQRTAPRSDQAPHVDMTLKIKAMKRKQGRVGFVVITGKREALGIKNRDTYYPAHIEYGYLAGPRVQGPINPAKGESTRAAARRLQFEGGRRHIPANPFMKRGLEQGRAEATEAIAQELSRRLKDSVGLSNLSDADLFGGPDVEEVV
jgi:HK97 gp10 family phage protein